MVKERTFADVISDFWPKSTIARLSVGRWNGPIGRTKWRPMPERAQAALVLEVKPNLGITAMTDEKTDQKKRDEKPPAPVLSGAPDRALELKVKKHPEDEDAKVDLGSDESMDASDPISTTQPGSSEPAPSSS